MIVWCYSYYNLHLRKGVNDVLILTYMEIGGDCNPRIYIEYCTATAREPVYYIGGSKTIAKQLKVYQSGCNITSMDIRVASCGSWHIFYGESRNLASISNRVFFANYISRVQRHILLGAIFRLQTLVCAMPTHHQYPYTKGQAGFLPRPPQTRTSSSNRLHLNQENHSDTMDMNQQK